MPDIITVLACLSQCLDPTTLRQLRRITEAMMSMIRTRDDAGHCALGWPRW